MRRKRERRKAKPRIGRWVKGKTLVVFRGCVMEAVKKEPWKMVVRATREGGS